MNQLLRQLFSTVDNQSWELGRVLWGVGVVAYIAYAGIALLVLHQSWNPVEYGTGFGAILATGGFAVAQKDKARDCASSGDQA